MVKQRDIHGQAEGHTLQQSMLVKAASFVILVRSDSCALKTARANQGGTGSSISIVEMLLPDCAGERATATRAGKKAQATMQMVRRAVESNRESNRKAGDAAFAVAGRLTEVHLPGRGTWRLTKDVQTVVTRQQHLVVPSGCCCCLQTRMLATDRCRPGRMWPPGGSVRTVQMRSEVSTACVHLGAAGAAVCR
jgi:hypothetical protein